jgi:hypothetical protein
MTNKLNQKTKQSNSKSQDADEYSGFVIIPYFMVRLIAQKKLKESDVKTYIAVRSFRNNDTSECFPGLDEIYTRDGLSDKAVKSALRRL